LEQAKSEILEQTRSNINNWFHENTMDEVMRDWDNYDVFSYGSTKEFKEGMVLIDESFVVKYPDIINPSNRERLLKMYT